MARKLNKSRKLSFPRNQESRRSRESSNSKKSNEHNSSNRKSRTQKGGHPNQILSTNNNSNNSNSNNSNNSNMSNLENLAQIDGEWVYKYYSQDADNTFNKNPNRCMCINYTSEDDFQSYDRCPNNVKPGTYFCEKHQNCKSYLRNFLSGSEYEDDSQLWNEPLIEGSHNCYSYFLNSQVRAVRDKCSEICHTKFKNIRDCIDNSGCTDLKPQPGSFKQTFNTGSDSGRERIYKCPEMQAKIIEDNPTIKPVNFNARCPPGYYKGAMVVDTKDSKNGNTYHFYKQISDGRFLHKPGINPVSNVDAALKGEKGRPIYIPHFSNRDYSDGSEGIFYNGFCGYYCIPRNDIVEKNLA